MSVHAGTIVHVGGNNVLDRLQNAGLSSVTVPTDVVREVGNAAVVDKVPGDPSFTFTLESQDVSAELEAFIAGKVAASQGSAGVDAPDADGTEYKWGNCEFVTVASPWKDPVTGSAGIVTAGHLVPGYYPTRISYNYGVDALASETVELSGGSFYYADGAPVEQFATGDGSTVAFATTDAAIPYRRGGSDGTTFKSVFGVIVDGQLMTEGVDFTQAPTNTAAAGVATVTFTVAPASGARIRFAYFTTATKSYPDPVHASTIVKPAAVRGRNICVYIGSGGILPKTKVGGVQTFTLDATVDGAFEREFCNEEIVGYTINGTDVNGVLTVRSRDAAAFMSLLAKLTGVDVSEVQGWLNTHDIPLQVEIQNPKNPGQILKTLYVPDAIFQPPGTPARVNTPTDFAISYSSKTGVYSAFKGAKAA